MPPTLFVTCFTLAVLCFWASRRPEAWAARRSSLRTGGLTFTLFSGALAYSVLQGSGAQTHIERAVPLYPGARQSLWFPHVDPDRYWPFDTPDTPAAITAFYRDAAQKHGWQFNEHHPSTSTAALLITTDTAAVSILANRHNAQTRFVYFIAPPPSP